MGVRFPLGALRSRAWTGRGPVPTMKVDDLLSGGPTSTMAVVSGETGQGGTWPSQKSVTNLHVSGLCKLNQMIRMNGKNAYAPG